MTDTDIFTYTRSFTRTPEALWPLLTEAQHRNTWGAPEDGKSLTTLADDFQIGGTDRQRCGPADAPEFEVETRWYAIEAPSLLVSTETIEADGMRLGTSLVTTAITATDTGCTAAFTVAVSSFVGPEMIAEFKSGWDGGIAKLELLAT